jgi:hypothetical protein
VAATVWRRPADHAPGRAPYWRHPEPVPSAPRQRSALAQAVPAAVSLSDTSYLAGSWPLPHGCSQDARTGIGTVPALLAPKQQQWKPGMWWRHCWLWLSVRLP